MTDKPEDKKKVVSIRKDLKVEALEEDNVPKILPEEIAKLEELLERIKSGVVTEVCYLAISNGNNIDKMLIEYDFLGQPFYPEFTYVELLNQADDYREATLRPPLRMMLLEDE
jgi:hypothetical protein